MCRIFGFRSIIQSQVHHSLINTENALGFQSILHPDGWGVAYYQAGAPHVIKSEATAVDDQLFQKVSGIVSSETVLAHIRKATMGDKTILNTHPFQYGKWTFIHNGNIKNWNQHKNELRKMVSPQLKRFILGETDSETIFMIILSHLDRLVDLRDRQIEFSLINKAVKSAIKQIVGLVGPYCEDDSLPNTETFLTFTLTNGSAMVSFQGGKNLYYSTFKSVCPERDSCPSFAENCEEETLNGYVNHLIFSSEPLVGKNIWIFMKPGEILGVDESMQLHRDQLSD